MLPEAKENHKRAANLLRGTVVLGIAIGAAWDLVTKTWLAPWYLKV